LQLITHPGTNLTMTSREIAALTGKQHNHVMRDIRNLLDALGMGANLDSCAKSTTYEGRDGRQYAQYELDKATCLTLLLGYDAAARMKVVIRWQELEQYAATRAAYDIPPDYSSALRLAADALDKVVALEHTVSEQAPKVEVYDRIVEDTGTYLVRAAAKLLDIGPRQLVKWMLGNGWAYRHADKGPLLARQDKLDKGWLAHKLRPFFNCRTQRQETAAALRVTPRGLTVLTRETGRIATA